MSTKHLHLVRRGAIYYWRRRLPSDIGRILGRTHYVRSLRTAEPTIARLRARRLTLVGDELLLRLRLICMSTSRHPDKADLERILADLFSEILDGGEANRLARPVGEWPWSFNEDWSEEEIEMASRQQPEDNAMALRAQLQMNDLSTARAAVEQKLRKQNLEIPVSDGRYRAFLRKALATMAAAHAIDAQREHGIYEPAHHPFLSLTPSTAHDASSDEVGGDLELISSAFADYCAERLRLGQWKPGTDRDANEALRLFLDLRGDIPVAQVTRSDAVAFRQKLSMLPSNRGKSNGIYEGKTASECIEIRSKLEKAASKATSCGELRFLGKLFCAESIRAHTRTITPKTINKHLSMMRRFFEWKKECGTLAGRNPFDGLSHKKSEVRKAMAKRDIWRSQDLDRLFHSPVWCGCASRTSRAVSGPHIYEDGRFWIPLLGLYTGMRLEEICLLPVNAVQTVRNSDTVLIEVNGTKTESAKRTIPMHNELKKMGLLAFVARMREAGHRFLRGGPGCSDSLAAELS